MSFQTIVHYSLHFLFPIFIAWFWEREQWKKAYLVLLATMLVDIDHFWAKPIFDPERCSIGFHIFHTYPAIFLYVIGFALSKNKWWKLVFFALIFHMITDAIDCVWMRFL